MLALSVPNLLAYDPAFAYEIAIIIQDGIKRMYVDQDSVFYYRIHSPVILIEFDHQRGVALDNDQPSRNHIHTVVRTPNGNDYGKDLLRQHHAQFDHQPGRPHHVRR